MLESLVYAFETSPALFYSVVTVFGLCVGSFLNVVVYRLPLMMERDWKDECHAFLELEPAKHEEPLASMNLSAPPSACPNCGHKIRFYENIPVLSWLLLRGKCAGCATAISIQYPLVELFTGILSIFVAMQFGVSLQTVAVLMLTWVLVALTLIDIKKMLLPDSMTLPLLWLGLLCNLFGLFTSLEASVIGAMAGYLVLWSVYQLFKLVTGKEGMGFGDFKLLAALGAWMGFAMLPQIILISALVGSVVGISMVVTGMNKSQQPIPFGPYLAIAGWIAMLWGAEINQAYFSML